MIVVSILGLILIITGAAAIGFFAAALCTIGSVQDLQAENNFYQEMLVIKEREIKEYEHQFGVIHFDEEGNIITDDIPIRSN